MIYPSMSALLKKVDSRYTLVIEASKRARMLTEGAQKLTDHESPRDVTIAIYEIFEGKVGYHRIGKNAVEEEPKFVSESVTKSKPQWESKRLVDEDDSEWSDDDLNDDDDEIADDDSQSTGSAIELDDSSDEKDDDDE